MERKYISELAGCMGQEVLLKGWIFQVKDFSRFAFVSLRDRTGIVQLVAKDRDIVRSLKLEAAVEVKGKALERPPWKCSWIIERSVCEGRTKGQFSRCREKLRKLSADI